MYKVLRGILDVGCLILLTSVVMDTFLWVSGKYLIPCWTMAVLSGGLIALLHVLKRQLC